MINLNILEKIIKDSDGITIYNLSLLNREYYYFIRSNYFKYTLSKDFKHFSQIYDTLDETKINAQKYENINIHFCITKRFTENDINNFFQYDNSINYSYLGRIYYVITPFYIKYLG